MREERWVALVTVVMQEAAVQYLMEVGRVEGMACLAWAMRVLGLLLQLGRWQLHEKSEDLGRQFSCRRLRWSRKLDRRDDSGLEVGERRWRCDWLGCGRCHSARAGYGLPS